MEQSELEQLKARVLKLEEQVERQRTADQPDQRHEAIPEITPPSQRRSNMASTELLQQPDFTAPSYPMNTIMEAQDCHLMAQWGHPKVKAAVGSIAPREPGATFH